MLIHLRKLCILLLLKSLMVTFAQAGSRLAGVQGADGTLHVAVIVSASEFTIYSGQENKWQSRTIAAIESSLVPGAPLVLSPLSKDLPKDLRILTIGMTGQLVSLDVISDSNSKIVPSVLSFSDFSDSFLPGSDFGFAEKSLFIVGQSGRLWESNLETKAANLVEVRANVVLPGGSIRMLEGQSDEIFLIDRRGNLVSYVRDPVRNWKGPILIGTGFLAGSDLVVWKRPDGGRETYVAAVNGLGEIRISRREKEGWKIETVPGWVIPSGSPLAVFHTPINIRLFGVNSDGRLQVMHLVNTEWRERIIATGMNRYSTSFVPTQTQISLAIDASGDLISSTSQEDVWTSFLTPADGGSESGTVISRMLNDAVNESHDVTFWNRSDSEIIFRLRDLRNPFAIQNVTIAAGASHSRTLDFVHSRRQTTKLKQVASTSGGAKEQTTEIERTRETPGEFPYVIEALS
ncbi:MAG: hypothetical protein FJ267_08850, partial [Planctomycetes bacterium]|nr:hypothetical protein [Planctomycetota bacterium]